MTAIAFNKEAERTITIDASGWLDTISDETNSLNVSNQSLSDQLGSAIVRALPSSVVKLDLKGNSFSSQTASALAVLLQRNTSIQQISLDSNPLNTGSDGLISFTALAKSLKENTTLRSLSLFRCGIGKKGCAILAQALQKNSTLISLDLDRNICDETDLNSIKEKLSRNRKLYEEELAAKARAEELERKAAQQKLQEEDAIQKEKGTLEWLEAEKATREESRRTELELQRIKELEELAYKERMDQIHKMEEERKAAKKKKKKKGKGKKKKK